MIQNAHLTDASKREANVSVPHSDHPSNAIDLVQREECCEETKRWSPSGSSWKDFLHFCGPGWFVAIAYIDPGNTQADINAGATARYNLLWTVWWASILSIYVQVLCARLAVRGQITLAEVQRDNFPKWFRYLAWVIAEFSVIITDLPEVIGFGIALNIFFNIPYYVGVLISPVTTFAFLATQEWNSGIRIMEIVIVFLIAVMSLSLFVEWGLVGTETADFFKGWVYGFALPKGHDIFSILGIMGAVVMPHNLYLHSASVLSRPVVRKPEIIKKAQFLTAIEPIFPIIFSFFINAAIVAIAAMTIFGEPWANDAGNTDFANYLINSSGRPVLVILFGIALLAAAQSSSITTTYSGQYVMEGFLRMRMKVWHRALLTRGAALIPCVIIAATMDENALNQTINVVNATLALLLPFALTPLVKFSTSEAFLGKENLPSMFERSMAWLLAFIVYAVNAFGMSALGGGFFGALMQGDNVTLAGTDDSIQVQTPYSVQMAILNDALQILYLAWNVYVVLLPVKVPMRDITSQRDVKKEKCFGVVHVFGSEKGSLSMTTTQ
jgi:natural resistance-associated macrophage protein